MSAPGNLIKESSKLLKRTAIWGDQASKEVKDD
jgi:hypothetical protein